MEERLILCGNCMHTYIYVIYAHAWSAACTVQYSTESSVHVAVNIPVRLVAYNHLLLVPCMAIDRLQWE